MLGTVVAVGGPATGGRFIHAKFRSAHDRGLGAAAEAVIMLSLIDRGGPYRYAQDGTVFGNNEGLLPKHARGYYHEYTVVTPESKDRGTRRLIVGRLGDVYYTSDHYESFRQVIR